MPESPAPNAPHASIGVNVFDTPASIFDALARVFPLTESKGSRWVTLASHGATVTFFAYDVPAEPEPEVAQPPEPEPEPGSVAVDRVAAAMRAGDVHAVGDALADVHAVVVFEADGELHEAQVGETVNRADLTAERMTRTAHGREYAISINLGGGFTAHPLIGPA